MALRNRRRWVAGGGGLAAAAAACAGGCGLLLHADDFHGTGGATAAAATQGSTSGAAGASATGSGGSGGHAVCGDGTISPGEQCDDMNTTPGDGCSATCQRERVTVVAIGAGHSCASIDFGAVKCWGYSGYGNLGLGTTADRGDKLGQMGADLPAVDLGAGKLAKAVALGENFSCALLTDATVKCWGINTSGQLGLGDLANRGAMPGQMGDALPTIDLGPTAKVTMLSLGRWHSCALLADGNVKCWGWNNYGQLGQGDLADRGGAPGQMGDALVPINLGGKKAKTVAAGQYHTCARLEDGYVKCWGYNAFGQLGLEHTTTKGGMPGEMASLPPVYLGGNAIDVAASGFTSCALLSGGAVKCWGYNGTGQLGQGDAAPRGDKTGDMGKLQPIDLGAGASAVKIAVGSEHVCALLADGRLKCWGSGLYGRLGLGNSASLGNKPGDMGDKLPAVDLGTGRTALSVACGGVTIGVAAHTCARLDDGTVKCWGYNGYGELGLGDTNDRGDVPGEMGDALPAVKLLSAFW